VDAARDGDTVLVAPGVYNEAVTLSKNITLASHFLKTKDEKHIAETVLDGAAKKLGEIPIKGKFALKVAEGTGPGLKIIGFTIKNASDGITCGGTADILHNHFTGNSDGLDYEGGGGLCRFNTFERNTDDGVDLDGATAAVIADNVIRDNEDDGIEIRLHEYSGPTLNIVIRNNIISGNKEDGIQIIDYPDNSDRVIRIERNLILKSAMAAIGCMSNGNTNENYEGADIPERIYLFHNTIVDNKYGVTGGDNLIALNNIFLNTKKLAMKKVDGSSVAAFNLFWNNGTDFRQSNVEEASTLRKDPLLGDDYGPKSGSPCLDAGTREFSVKGEKVFQLERTAYTGAAPDLGALEFTP
jgi:hypothetical protein